jgi:hypothetical protein
MILFQPGISRVLTVQLWCATGEEKRTFLVKLFLTKKKINKEENKASKYLGTLLKIKVDIIL